MEKIIKPLNGFLALILTILALIGAIYCFAIQSSSPNSSAGYLGGLLLVIFFFMARGLTLIYPNQSKVLVFFGTYTGSIKVNGLFWVNPFYSKTPISLRFQNLNGQILKVNDRMGNPIEIAAVIVWQVEDTYRALFQVASYEQYVTIQSEAAVRHLASSCPYDRMEDQNAELTLRDGAEKVNELLETELHERLSPAGIVIKEARISHLAYAPEIAGAMLQRQQATAIVAARTKIVEGAVGMVEMALDQLSQRKIVELDDEKKASMVSNLMVVLCGERAAQPVLNTGTLYA